MNVFSGTRHTLQTEGETENAHSEGGQPVRVHRSILVVLGLSFAIAACSAAKRPVLYPNEHLQQVGDAAVTHDTDECMRLAEQYTSGGGQNSQVAKEVARDTAIGGATGAAVGAASGAIFGSAGKGAAAGAVGGAAAGLLSRLFRGGSSSPDPLYMNFVNRCLQERGYEPIGWK